MDVFRLRNELIDDYSSYVRSFIHIRDPRIRLHVDERLEEGHLWPEPLIQLNPSFEAGETIDQLADRKVIHDECRRIFRIRKDRKPGGDSLHLHRHQAEAVKTARSGGNYVLTTGTGSGKSLAYIIPIVDHVLRRGAGRGIQAIVVYPMNALANSQYGELGKFLRIGYPDGRGPVTFDRYTGQEDDEERKRICGRPPDILLTNYVMLELILTRPYEKDLLKSAMGLRFLVLDELHTYRGRQGADVALLVRRLRDRLDAADLQVVGTSATLAGSGTLREQQQEVARVATLLFGAPVKPEAVIGETLRRTTPELDRSSRQIVEALRRRIDDPTWKPPHPYAEFVKDPLSSWIESAFGISKDQGTGELMRARPRSITGKGGAAEDLSHLTGCAEDHCAAAIRKGLLGGYQAEPRPETGFPAFAFRLHQFISRGDTVYASLEPEDRRHITVHGQQYVPGSDRNRILLPLVFCRECGEAYYCVRLTRDSAAGMRSVIPRELNDRFDGDNSRAGFLHRSEERPWPANPEEVLERVPQDWLEEHRGGQRVKRDQRGRLPEPLRLGTGGVESPDGLDFHFLPAPFPFCPACRISYSGRQLSDFGKLSTLASEGRSTATTILALSVVRRLLAEESLAPKARKLLSFTDNRQDASLQAGHFNDFVEVGLLRAALYSAARERGPEGLSHDELTQRVFDALSLPLTLYAADAEVRFAALADTQKALRDVIGYCLYRDLERGWRLTSPNLEQCGLLEVRYESLDEVCAAEDVWKGSHPVLAGAAPETRRTVARTLLDFMRRELAIKPVRKNKITERRTILS